MAKRVDLKSFSNSEYHPQAGVLKRLFWFILGRTFINTYLPFPQAIKKNVLRGFGAHLGIGIVVKPKVNIKYPWLLEIGDYSWIGENVWIDNLVRVEIGANCCLSQGAMLLTGNHNFKKSTFDLITGEIHLEGGVWVGAKATVCPGVIMKSHSILSVGSTLSKDAQAYGIYKGNPAEKVRDRRIE